MLRNDKLPLKPGNEIANNSQKKKFRKGKSIDFLPGKFLYRFFKNYVLVLGKKIQLAVLQGHEPWHFANNPVTVVIIEEKKTAIHTDS